MSIGITLAALATAGCGWQPLYAQPSADPVSGGIRSAMARIAIDPVAPAGTPDSLSGSRRSIYDSRAAQQLQNNLRDRLNPHGPPTDPLYHLTVELKQTGKTGLSLGNGESTREDLTMVASYAVIDQKGSVVLSDEARVITSYDVVQEPFSDLSASNDALGRGVEQLALMIETRLAVFLKR